MKKTAIITGATGGVGLALCERLIQLGWEVIGIARDKDKLASVEQRLGENFHGHLVELGNSDSVERFFEDARDRYRGVGLVVNNAAVFTMKPYVECSLSDVDRLIDTNLKGVMYITLMALKWMKETGGFGRIVNIGSVAGLHGIENQAIYCGSKFGMRGFAEALNQETIKNNISITTISPGGIKTPLWNEGNPYPGNIDSLLKPEDIVGMVEHVIGQDPRVVVKEITLFPSNEWH